jgi:hypothetical protein
MIKLLIKESGYKANDYALWLFDKEDNLWKSWGSWPRPEISEEEFEEINYKEFPNPEYNVNGRYSDYMVLPNDGSEPDDGKPVKKYNYDESLKESGTMFDYTDQIVIVINGRQQKIKDGYTISDTIIPYLNKSETIRNAVLDWILEYVGDDIVDYKSSNVNIADMFEQLVENEMYEYGLDDFYVDVSDYHGNHVIEIFNVSDFAESLKKQNIKEDDERYINNFIELDSKEVKDSDGWWNEYTLYMNIQTTVENWINFLKTADKNDPQVPDEWVRYVCVFGDRELYDPNDGYDEFDYECESKKEAYEWFDNYEGFDDEEDEDYY